MGFACEAKPTTGLCGSDPYISPEVLANHQQPYDPKAVDIWLLGIIYVAIISKCFPWSIATIKNSNFKITFSTISK